MALMSPPSLVTATVPVLPMNWSAKEGRLALEPRPEVSPVLVMEMPVQA